MFPTPRLSELSLFLLWSAWALKIGPGGVVSCVVYGTSKYMCIEVVPGRHFVWPVGGYAEGAGPPAMDIALLSNR